MAPGAVRDETSTGRHGWLDFVFFLIAAITWAEIIVLGARTHGYERVDGTDIFGLKYFPHHWARWTLLLAIGAGFVVTVALMVARRDQLLLLWSRSEPGPKATVGV